MATPRQGTLFSSSVRDTTLRVGPAGWSYKDWEGIVYPAPGSKSPDHLEYLAEYFDTVEINSSFYAPPDPRVVDSWTRRVRNNPNFRFTAKAWQRITHAREDISAAAIAADCDKVRRAMAPLADAGLCGALLVQFPWSFRHSPANLEHLDRIIHALGEFPLAIEVRHGSWNQASFYLFLQENQVAFCNVDQPVIGNSLSPSGIVTSRVGYFRLHGRNYKDWFRENAGRDERYNYMYSKKEIRELAGQIRGIQQVAAETYAITNNHFRGQAVVNALEILEECGGAPPAVPPLLAQAYPNRLRLRA